jgi:hypothetical protein
MRIAHNNIKKGLVNFGPFSFDPLVLYVRSNLNYTFS